MNPVHGVWQAAWFSKTETDFNVTREWTVGGSNQKLPWKTLEIWQKIPFKSLENFSLCCWLPRITNLWSPIHAF